MNYPCVLLLYDETRFSYRRVFFWLTNDDTDSRVNSDYDLEFNGNIIGL